MPARPGWKVRCVIENTVRESGKRANDALIRKGARRCNARLILKRRAWRGRSAPAV